MATAPSSWDVDSLAWDTAYIDDVVVPGRSKVKGSIRAEIEEKKAKGNDKASTTYLGRKATRFSLVTELDSNEFATYAATVLTAVNARKQGQGQGSVRVDHPSLQGTGIGKCLVAEVSLPEVRDDRLMIMTIDFVESIPKPPPVKPAPAARPQPTQAELEALSASSLGQQQFTNYEPIPFADPGVTGGSGQF